MARQPYTREKLESLLVQQEAQHVAYADAHPQPTKAQRLELDHLRQLAQATRTKIRRLDFAGADYGASEQDPRQPTKRERAEAAYWAEVNGCR